MDISDIDANMQRVVVDFNELVGSATRSERRAKTNGTKWTNEQLLFHMLFGFLLVRALLVLVKGLSRLPDSVSHAFAAVLNTGTRAFHVINYLSALPGGTVLRGRTMRRLMDHTIRHLRTACSANRRARSHSLCTSRPAGIPTSTTS